MIRKFSDAKVKNSKLKPDGKINKIADGGGLFLLVNSTGKYWRYSYRYRRDTADMVSLIKEFDSVGVKGSWSVQTSETGSNSKRC